MLGGRAYRSGMNDASAANAADFARAQGEFVRTELELGDTFLDIARTTPDPAHARVCMRSARAALESADKFMAGSMFHEAEVAEVHDRRERLATRLRDAQSKSSPTSV